MSAAICAAVTTSRQSRCRNQHEDQESNGEYLNHVLDLAALASVTVPAHGFVTGGRGASTGRMAGTFVPWLRRLFGAVAIASMIALGLFVYTEFTASWKKRGLPSIPISALAALEAPVHQQTTHPQAPTRGTPTHPNQRQQRFNALNDYVG